jgi:hypothetical protein
MLKKTSAPTKVALNRPVYSNPYTVTFPGCLIEKYMGHTQGDPMASIEKRYVLVTPKAIELLTGELVTISNNTYTILIPHVLDEYKNEYEIIERKDA